MFRYSINLKAKASTIGCKEGAFRSPIKMGTIQARNADVSMYIDSRTASIVNRLSRAAFVIRPAVEASAE